MAMIAENFATLALNGVDIVRRSSDGYIDATLLCQAGGKLYGNWCKADRVKTFLDVLNPTIPAGTLAIYMQEGGNGERHTWVHPQVAIKIAQWISPIFDIQVTKWIYELATFGKVELGKEHTNEEIEQMRRQLANVQLENQQLLTGKSEAEASADRERQQREEAEEKAENERQQREEIEAELEEVEAQAEQNRLDVEQERLKVEKERQINLRLQMKIRRDEIRRRFYMVKRPENYYNPDGYIYVEASRDDFARSIFGVGLTGDLPNRLSNYQSKSTGAAKREFLKVWHVWNRQLVENIIKEVLAPWANPEQKQKATKKAQATPTKRQAKLSKAELFDIPFNSLVKIIDVIVNRFKEITTALRNMATEIVDVASEPPPEFDPIEDIQKLVADLAPQKYLITTLTNDLRERLEEYTIKKPPGKMQGARDYYLQVRHDLADISEPTIRSELERLGFESHKSSANNVWRRKK